MTTMYRMAITDLGSAPARDTARALRASYPALRFEAVDPHQVDAIGQPEDLMPVLTDVFGFGVADAIWYATENAAPEN